MFQVRIWAAIPSILTSSWFYLVSQANDGIVSRFDQLPSSHFRILSLPWNYKSRLMRSPCCLCIPPSTFEWLNQSLLNLVCISWHRPITVAPRSKAWTVFARSNAGIVVSNPTQGMDVCVRLFCVCAVLCVGTGLATVWSPARGVLPTVYTIKKLKKGTRA
jgi:hypothetical protein